jgi:hypothetical protein
MGESKTIFFFIFLSENHFHFSIIHLSNNETSEKTQYFLNYQEINFHSQPFRYCFRINISYKLYFINKQILKMERKGIDFIVNLVTEL